ncbi:MAG: mannose-1-phosphate guanylyltransferase [Bacteroidales bacterium]|nr:mannose-1-phosphate guanylyltransferase [Bacteroidales bacterium]MBR6160497.1 mannose-1-phosphate guanylyltransferase [Bacteroidales bacterium]
MTNPNYYCVIMAGGVGARFWPMSNSSTPKQFIDILGEGKTLIQKTFSRFTQICPKENIYIVTSKAYKDITLQQLPEIAEEQVILEPYRRNTAPCIAYANYKIRTRNPNATIVVAPSDHVILKEDVFTRVIEQGLEAASHNDWLLTIGIRPSSPNTGYGYIQYDEDRSYDKNATIYAVKTFTEKPELEMAKSFLQSGDFLWNAGIFMWSLPSIQKAFETFLPDVDELFKQGEGLYGTDKEEAFIDQIYQICRSISIDYGVMEHAQNVKVIAADFGWSDLGTWGSLYELRAKDAHKNSIVGNHVKTYDTEKCIIHVPKNKVVVVQGLEDYIVVENNDVLLICKKSEEQQIRQYVTDVQVDFGNKYV